MNTRALPELERRRLNVWEALIVAGLTGMAWLLFSTREAVIRLQATQEATNTTLSTLQSQLASVPALTQQVSRLEVRVGTLEEDKREDRERRR